MNLKKDHLHTCANKNTYTYAYTEGYPKAFRVRDELWIKPMQLMMYFVKLISESYFNVAQEQTWYSYR